MKSIFVLFAGFLIGIANIIPGLSGATVAISLGIYERLIEALTNLRQNFRQYIPFLLLLVIGALIGIVVFAKGIVISFEKYELWTVCFFIGLILGGIPYIYSKTSKKLSFSNILAFIIAGGLVLLLGFANIENGQTVENVAFLDYLMIILVGFLGAAAMIVPGISGAFIFIVLGYYNYILETINNLTNPDLFFNSLFVLSLLALGIIIGLFTIAKMIKYFINKHCDITYFAILGIVVASVIILFIPFLPLEVIFYQAVVALLLIDAGFFITYLLGGLHD